MQGADLSAAYTAARNDLLSEETPVLDLLQAVLDQLQHDFVGMDIPVEEIATAALETAESAFFTEAALEKGAVRAFSPGHVMSLTARLLVSPRIFILWMEALTILVHDQIPFRNDMSRGVRGIVDPRVRCSGAQHGHQDAGHGGHLCRGEDQRALPQGIRVMARLAHSLRPDRH